MNPAIYKAIKGLLESDSSVTPALKTAVLRACEEPDVTQQARNTPRPQFVTVKEASEILNTSKRTIWRLARIGKIRRIKLGHRSTRFRLDDIASITSVEGSILATS
ncbi:MAG: helix-turn-helix domain-containing protein [bacterium]